MFNETITITQSVLNPLRRKLSIKEATIKNTNIKKPPHHKRKAASTIFEF